MDFGVEISFSGMWPPTKRKLNNIRPSDLALHSNSHTTSRDESILLECHLLSIENYLGVPPRRKLEK